MPTKDSKPLDLEPWIWWQRSRSCLKIGAASSYLALWFMLTQPLKGLHGGVFTSITLITVFWGYIAYRGIKSLDHPIVTPLNGLLWSIWIVLALFLFVSTFLRKLLHFL